MKPASDPNCVFDIAVLGTNIWIRESSPSLVMIMSTPAPDSSSVDNSLRTNCNIDSVTELELSILNSVIIGILILNLLTAHSSLAIIPLTPEESLIRLGFHDQR